MKQEVNLNLTIGCGSPAKTRRGNFMTLIENIIILIDYVLIRK